MTRAEFLMFAAVASAAACAQDNSKTKTKPKPEKEANRMTLRLSGPFTEAEIKQFVDLMRAIEHDKPENTYMALVNTPDLSGAEAEQLMQRVFPPVKDRARSTVTLANPKDPCAIQFFIGPGPSVDITVPNMSPVDLREVIAESWMPNDQRDKFKALLAQAKAISLTMTSRCEPEKKP